ncbi:uncharacterized protein LOC123037812 [Drosophila rhopaloa]|uniref:Uncharacterized protein n=1 Tax=Drosophila rhopaloa TaxID=1041015 RepID=A0ABM5JBS4_DRORH|nr:uncharacterized protein LOC123037812 [Drosophila rhopaloa]
MKESTTNSANRRGRNVARRGVRDFRGRGRVDNAGYSGASQGSTAREANLKGSQRSGIARKKLDGLNCKLVRCFLKSEEAEVEAHQTKKNDDMDQGEAVNPENKDEVSEKDSPQKENHKPPEEDGVQQKNLDNILIGDGVPQENKDLIPDGEVIKQQNQNIVPGEDVVQLGKQIEVLGKE